jgi:hypothetical protein
VTTGSDNPLGSFGLGPLPRRRELVYLLEYTKHRSEAFHLMKLTGTIRRPLSPLATDQITAVPQGDHYSNQHGSGAEERGISNIYTRRYG